MGSSTPPRPGSPAPEKPQPCSNAVTAKTAKDPLFMTEKEMLIESVRNSRLTLSVTQDIAEILRNQ